MASKVSISPVIYENFRRLDGNYTVKIRVTYARKTRYVLTNVYASPKQLSKSLEPKDPRLKDQIEGIVLSFIDAANQLNPIELSGRDVDYVLSRIEQIIKKETFVFELDFFEYGEKIALEKPRNSKINYMCAIHSLQEYTGLKKMDITAITSSMMRGYESFLRKKHGDNARAVSLYTAAIAYIHKRAQLEYNNLETGEVYIKNPFDYYKCPKQRPAKHRATSIDVIQKLIDMRESLSGRQRTGVDMFLLSFGLMGMNSPDMYECKPPKNGVLIYERVKTRERRADNAEMHVRIEEEIKTIYGEYTDSTRKRAFRFHLRYSDYKNLSRAANLGLCELSKTLKLEQKLTVYAARHAWATIAYSIGVNKAVINDCLIHVDRDMRTTDIYVEKDWSVLWKANKQVLSCFKWK